VLCFVELLSLSLSFDVNGVGVHHFRRTFLHHQAGVFIRDFEAGDGAAVLDLLQDNESGFDPEGPIHIDCGSDAALEESYCQDGGCFLVAVKDDNNNNEIVGTVGLVVGTSITYLKTGDSILTGAITGAVRRVCSQAVSLQASTSESTLQALLAEIEKRAMNAHVNELIILAYPSLTCRPSPPLLTKLGFKQLPAQLSGADALQFGKRLLDNE